ncbi:MAG: hypothetical protein JWR61_3792 [Ferruginibacter sp.]|nr:hypothetical protein [Ferruginibacter sp.]
MISLNVIIGIVALTVLGYVLLNNGLHEETAQEKMINPTKQSPLRNFRKWHIVILGIVCWGFALYLAFIFLTSVV